MTNPEIAMPPDERIEIDAGEGVAVKTMLIDDVEEVAEQVRTHWDYYTRYNQDMAEGYRDAATLVRAVQHSLRPSSDRRMFVTRQDGTLIGGAELRKDNGSAEVSYWVRPDYASWGYGTRELNAVSKWALSGGGYERLYAHVAFGNEASRRVLEKAGYTYLGAFPRKGVMEWRFELTNPKGSTGVQ